MPGQWEFQIGPLDTVTVADHVWVARYLLFRLAEKHGIEVTIEPKPMLGDWKRRGHALQRLDQGDARGL